MDPVEDPGPGDWGDVASRLLRNDKRALAQVIRLITGHLTALRAYDLGESKYDLIQDVLAALVKSLQRAELRESRAFVSYVGMIVRNKFFDLRRRAATERDIARILSTDTEENALNLPTVDLFDLRDALAELTDKEWNVVDLHYNQGRTFDQIAVDLDIPRGSVSGLLRSALGTLRAAITDRGAPAPLRMRAD